jgi:hypothetical protein
MAPHILKMQLQKVLRPTITTEQMAAILAYFNAVRNRTAYVHTKRNLDVLCFFPLRNCYCYYSSQDASGNVIMKDFHYKLFQIGSIETKQRQLKNQLKQPTTEVSLCELWTVIR